MIATTLAPSDMLIWLDVVSAGDRQMMTGFPTAKLIGYVIVKAPDDALHSMMESVS